MADPKFKPGDKVRIANFQCGEKRKFDGGFHVGDILTIAKSHTTALLNYYYEVKESDTYIFWEKELELYVPNSLTISAEIPLNDKKTAYNIVTSLVEKAYHDDEIRKKNARRWTTEEVMKAKDICVKISTSIIKGGGGVHWRKGNGNKDEVYCDVNYSIMSSIHTGKATANNSDDFNVWIGKCVSLCKALNKPIPDFIKNKNVEGR